jgi:hypothetical protein
MTVSFPAKAGNPVRRSLSMNHNRLGVLDRPVKPGDDSRASKLVGDLRQHLEQGFAVGLAEQLVEP